MGRVLLSMFYLYMAVVVYSADQLRCAPRESVTSLKIALTWPTLLVAAAYLPPGTVCERR